MKSTIHEREEDSSDDYLVKLNQVVSNGEGATVRRLSLSAIVIVSLKLQFFQSSSHSTYL